MNMKFRRRMKTMHIMDYLEFYETNADFKEYLDKYCTKHNLTVAEACKHLIVRITANYYKEIEK